MAAEVLGSGQPDGTTLGRSNDKISLYGETPVVQKQMTVAVGTDIATVILELAEIRAALVGLGVFNA